MISSLHRRIRRQVPRSLCVLALVTAPLLAAPSAVSTAHGAPAAIPAPVQSGVAFAPMTLAEALVEAKRTGKRVFADFDASWCPSCRQLEREVLHTPEGAALLQGLLSVRVDFDDERNRALIERYVILGLPTALVLDADGNQLVRVTGFEEKASWMTPMRAALTARDPLPALQLACAERPDDADARLALGKALLVHGGGNKERTDAALSQLESLLWAGVGAEPAAQAAADERAAEALWTLGRYHQRVRRDPATAQHAWRELATRFPGSSWAGGAWSWYAKAQAELGRPQVGATALAAAARRQAGPDAIAAWLSYSKKHGLKAERAAIVRAIETLSPNAATALRAELSAWR